MSEDKIAKEAEALNIMTFKLSSGDEVMGIVARNKPNESIVLLEGALKVVHKYSRVNNSFTIDYQEYSPLAKDDLTSFNRHGIVAYSLCSPEAKTQYLRTMIMLHTNELNEADLSEMPEDTATEEELYDHLSDGNTIVH